MIIKNTILLFLISIAFTSSAFENPYTTYVEKRFGSQPVSAELEAYIASLAQEMGIKQSFKIKQIHAQAIKTVGAENAFCYPGYLFVHEPFLKVLSEPEKKFLISHELAHIFHKHPEQRIALIAINISTFCATIAGMYYYKKNKITMASIGLSYLSFIKALQYLCKNMPHNQELQADEMSVRFNKDIQGAEAFFSRIGMYNPRAKDMSSLTHPSLTQRLEAIKKINYTDLL